MIHRVLAMVMLAIAVSTVSVYADDELDTLAAGVERSAATPQAERAAVDRMAKALATAPDTLRAERAASRLGWGDLYIAYRIATRGGHPVDKVVDARRRSGATWTQIAEEAGVEPMLIAQDVFATWPELKRKPAPASPPKASEPARDTREPAPVKPPDAAEEVRDKILRGGGMRGR
jgi:hypothetical protein